MTAPWYRQKNITEIAASLRTALGFGTAADQDVEDFATPDDLSALETSVNDAIAALTLDVADAGNLSSGTVPDACLPEWLQAVCKTITDWNDAVYNGWYMQDMSAASALTHAPVAGQWTFGIVIAHQTQWLEQRVTVFTAEEYGARPVYVRWRISGAWTAWQRVYETEAEIQSIVGAAPNRVVFTASGTYTPPAKLKWAEITVIGGGGGWGNYNSSNVGGAGGGTAIKKVKAADLAASNAVVIGAGGALNTNGGNSSITLPGGTITGGGGGSGYSAGYLSMGGIGSGGDRNYKGSGGTTTTVGASSFDLNVTDLTAANWGYGHGGSSANAAKAGVVIIEEHF